jgi:hypothetical protein
MQEMCSKTMWLTSFLLPNALMMIHFIIVFVLQYSYVNMFFLKHCMFYVNVQCITTTFDECTLHNALNSLT